MENSDVLGDGLSELLLRKGTEPLLCSHWRELDGKIKGALMESNGVFKVRNSSECSVCRGEKSTRSASETHFLLQQNRSLPSGKEQQFTCSAGRKLLKIKGKQQAQACKRRPLPCPLDRKPGTRALTSAVFWEKAILL